MLQGHLGCLPFPLTTAGGGVHAGDHARTGHTDKTGHDPRPYRAHALDRGCREESAGKREALSLLQGREGFMEEVTFQLCFESKVWRCGSQAGEGEKSLPGKGKSTEPRDRARGAVLHRDLSTDWILSPTLTRGLNTVPPSWGGPQD